MAAEIAPAEHRAQKIQYQCCKRYPNSAQLYTETVISGQNQRPGGPAPCSIMSAIALFSTIMSSTSLPHDPAPQPPVRPGDNECCNSGCTWCILDMYQEELAAYAEKLRAWQQRQLAPATPALPPVKKSRTPRA